MSSILVIDTALEACSVGLASGSDILWQETRTMARGQQEALGPMVAAALDHCGLKPKGLSRIAVTLGPGSFTGLRIGLSFAKGLATGADVPLVGLGTLEALAAFEPLRNKTRLAVIDGGRGQAFLQVFAPDGSAQPPLILMNAEPDEISRTLSDLGPIDIITGPATALIPPWFPSAQTLPQATASIEAMAWLGLRAEPPFDHRPQYMREADARPSTRQTLTLQAP